MKKSILKMLGLLLVFVVIPKTSLGKVVIKLEEKSYTTRSVDLQMDGQKIDTEFAPYILKGRTFVPIRDLTEALGAKVKWDQKTKAIEISMNKKEIKLKIDSNICYVDGKKTKLDDNIIPKLTSYFEPRMEQKTVVPLRFISETFGYKVDFRSADDLVMIETGEKLSKSKAKDKLNQDIASKNGEGEKDEGPEISGFKSDEGYLIGGNTFISNNERNEIKKTQKKSLKKYYEEAGIDLDEFKDRKITKKFKSDGQITIVLDAGHGGKDSGGVAEGRVPEKELTIRTVFILQDMLKDRGYEVILTRDRDEYIKLMDRAGLSNDKNAELFLSIHYNLASSKTASGIEVLYADEKQVPIKTVEQRHFARALQRALIDETGTVDRGIKNRPDLIVLKTTKNVAALAELGFMSNDEEMDKIMEDGYIERMCQALVRGIENYVGEYEDR
ncbi:N-acetylmuramoyl-L-alanine amidase [Peptoniphilus sp. GNH]|nr:N-acetylmuramoyl-L-alanine amidase [Peptoniphilus sp. GNH]